MKSSKRVGLAVDTVKQKGRAGVDTVRATVKKKTPTSLPTPVSIRTYTKDMVWE